MVFTSAYGSRWAEFEGKLSGRTLTSPDGDSPVTRHSRDSYVPPEDLLRTRRGTDDPSVARVPYAELHTHSNFSFLDGASDPEELVEEAARLGLDVVT